MDLAKLGFVSLNGETLENVVGGKSDDDSHSTSTTDHACGSHGCGFSAGLLINRQKL